MDRFEERELRLIRSNEDYKEKKRRRIKLRNLHARELKESGAYHIRRVEPKKKSDRKRLTTREWMQKLEKDEIDELD